MKTSKSKGMDQGAVQFLHQLHQLFCFEWRSQCILHTLPKALFTSSKRTLTQYLFPAKRPYFSDSCCSRSKAKPTVWMVRATRIRENGIRRLWENVIPQRSDCTLQNQLVPFSSQFQISHSGLLLSLIEANRTNHFLLSVFIQSTMAPMVSHLFA